MVFSPDGKTLYSSSHDQTIKVWNVADGKLIRELKGHTGIVDSIAISPDGKRLASGSADKTVRLWNPQDGKELKNLGSHGNSVYTVVFSPDGKLLASAGTDGQIKLWDVNAMKEVKTLKGQNGPVLNVVFSPDGGSLVSIGFDRFVHVWSVAGGKEVKRMGLTSPLSGPTNVGLLASPPKQAAFLTALAIIGVRDPTPDDLYGIAFSRDGKDVVTSGYGGNVIIWSMADGKLKDSHKLPYGAYCVAFTPDGKHVITGHDNHMCYVTSIKP